MPDLTSQDYENAKQAASDALQAQAKTWGFSPEQTDAWKHIVNNGLTVINGNIELHQMGIPGELTDMISQDAAVDTSFMITSTGTRIANFIEKYKPQHQLADTKELADIIAQSGLGNYGKMESAIITALARVGARAAINSLNTSTKLKAPDISPS